MVTTAEANIQRKRIEVRRELQTRLKQRQYYDQHGRSRIEITKAECAFEGDECCPDWWYFLVKVDGIQVIRYRAEGEYDVEEEASHQAYLDAHIARVEGTT